MFTCKAEKPFLQRHSKPSRIPRNITRNINIWIAFRIKKNHHLLWTDYVVSIQSLTQKPSKFFHEIIFLKQLRNRILRSILMWPLFYLIRVYVGLYFYNFVRKTSFSSFCAFCAFCFESNVLNQDNKTCLIMLCNFAKVCFVILFSLYKS